VGPGELYAECSVAPKCGFSAKLTETGCEKADCDGARYGVYCAESNHESCVVAADPGTDDEHWTLDGDWGVGCDCVWKVYTCIEGVGGVCINCEMDMLGGMGCLSLNHGLVDGLYGRARY
jgi:hypothetical protein